MKAQLKSDSQITADPVMMAQELIRCKSITPKNDGAIELVTSWLKELGFECEIVEFSGDGSYPVKNLYAKYGDGSLNLCFAGHTDVVPVGEESAWKYPPFGGIIENGRLYGRGAVDMKAAICCFIAAARNAIDGGVKPTLSFLITGDEEADAVNGTAKVLKWLEAKGENITACIVGEPTSESKFIDTIKIGRRGSINFRLEVNGVQGHVAYKKNFDNPITSLVKILEELKSTKLDDGNQDFEPSNLEVVNIEVDNKATNVVPAKASAGFNIRFNNIHTATSLEKFVDSICRKHTARYKLISKCSGEAYICDTDQRFTNAVLKAIKLIAGNEAKIDTSGGISDARFIKKFCPAFEIGMLETTAHQVDECVNLDDIQKLTDIYEQIIRAYRSV